MYIRLCIKPEIEIFNRLQLPRPTHNPSRPSFPLKGHRLDLGTKTKCHRGVAYFHLWCKQYAVLNLDNQKVSLTFILTVTQWKWVTMLYFTLILHFYTIARKYNCHDTVWFGLTRLCCCLAGRFHASDVNFLKLCTCFWKIVLLCLKIS